MTFTVVERGLAGDESVLYRVEQPPEGGFFLAVIRVGDRVTTVRVGNEFAPGTARDLAVRAASRLSS